MEFKMPKKSDKAILALGAESAGNFSVYKEGGIYFSEDFGDLLDEENWIKYKKSVLSYLKKHNLKPDVIITDMHPFYVTTGWGSELAKKYKAKHEQVQHHIAHIFSACGENYNIIMRPPQNVIFFGIAADGTGYGLDGKVWGGEIFEFRMTNDEFRIKRIGHLENQVLAGADLAVREPARVLIGILRKILKKEEIFEVIKKYYTRKEFEVIHSQLEQGFNCLETSSTGRVLDAVSLLLGFSKNERQSKHAPIEALEKNSTKAFKLLPVISSADGVSVLETTPLFRFLVKNLQKDKKRLAATAQEYIAQGLWEIVKSAYDPEQDSGSRNKKQTSWVPGQARNDIKVYFAGGMANNKVISEYMEKRGVIMNKKIYPAKNGFSGVPRGDAGISLGQLIFYLTDSRN